jgi:hypothetical protein
MPEIGEKMCLKATGGENSSLFLLGPPDRPFSLVYRFGIMCFTGGQTTKCSEKGARCFVYITE